MASRLAPVFVFFSLLLAVTPAGYSVVQAGEQAFLPDGQAFLVLVSDDLADGRISSEEALLFRFQYGFAPEELPHRYQVADFSPLRCATGLIAEYYRERGRLTKETVDLIDDWLKPTAAKLQYISPDGRFAFTYETAGDDAIDAADVDPANGIPDYVEKIAVYFDKSWAVEIDTLNFAAPPLSGGTFAVSFESMQYYGYTTVVSEGAGSTRIVLHNSYIGFPANDDPEGNIAGAAKVTAAHEFKHATQFAATRWAEGGWSELDATWIEDVVFDQVNDYYNYLSGESPMRHPEIPLDGGANTSGSYEDCVWQIWLTESWGVQIIQDFWDRRALVFGESLGESVMESYRRVLNDRGVSLAEGWAAFTAWNYGVDSRAVPGLGYLAGTAYPQGPVFDTATMYPFATTGSVEHLAADFVTVEGFVDTSNEMLRIVFNGQDSAGPLTLAVHVARRDGTGLIEVIDLDANNDADHLLSVPARDVLTAGVVVGNAATFGLAGAWDLDLDLVPIPAVPAASLDQVSLTRTLVVGETGQEFVRLTNTGETGSLLAYTVQLWTTHPDSDLTAESASLWSDKSVAGSTFTCAVSSYLPGQLVNLDFTAFNGSGDDEWLTDLSLDFPAGVSVLVSSDFVGGGLGDLVNDNSLGDGALVSWHGTYGLQEYGVVRDGESAYGTVQVMIDPTFSGALDLAWTLGGDNFGSTPHQLAGTISLSEDSPVLQLQSPNGGEIYAVGDTFTVTWSTGGLVPAVDLDISPDGGETWSALAIAVANDGSERVALTGAPSNNCRLRVRAAGGGAADTSDGPFHLYTSPGWVAGSPTTGNLLDTEFQDLTLDLDATGLAPGNYQAWLVVLHSAPDTRTVVPVSLAVNEDPSQTGPSRIFAVHSAHPNPFNPSTTIAFELPNAALTTVDVLDVRGRLVRRVFQGRLPAGSRQQAWDGRDGAGRFVSAGVYLVRVRAGGFTGTVKVLLAK